MAIFDPTSILDEVNPLQGYVAFAIVHGTPVYVTGAQAVENGNPTIQEFWENGAFPGLGIQAQALHAAGTAIAGGNVEFDLASRGGSLLSLLGASQRGVPFTVVMGVASMPIQLEECQMESITIRSGMKQLVQGSISFKSAQEWQPAGFSPLLTRAAVVPYWATGNTKVKDWSITINNALKPIYKNDLSDKRPRYLRVGKTQGSVQITTLGGLRYHDAIAFGLGTLTVTAVVTEQAINQARRGTQNEYTYSLKLVGAYTIPPPGGSGGPAVSVSVVT